MSCLATDLAIKTIKDRAEIVLNNFADRGSAGLVMCFSDKPSEPQNLGVTEITKESVGLRWEPPESTGGMDITQYVVEKRDMTRGGNWIQAATVDGGTTKHAIGKLIEGNEYLFRVVAENKIGTGPPAELSQPVAAKLPYGTTSNQSSRLISSRLFKCSLTMAKHSFYRAANAIFGKIGGRATEDVILQLIRSKCLPALLYDLEACPLRKADSNYWILLSTVCL